MTVHGQLAWWAALALILAHAACTDRTPTGPFVDSTAGTSGGSGGDRNATGGLPGSAGNGGQAGAGGAASSVGTARGTGSGGQTGTGGAASSAGTAGTGGRMGSGGNSGGVVGSSAGTGGRAGTGGSSTGAGGTTVNSGSSTAVSTSVSFAQDVQPIYMAKCASCHGVTQANVYSWFQGATTGPCAGRGKRVDILVSKITTPICGTKMPERSSLTTAELNALTGWAQAGAPNN